MRYQSCQQNQKSTFKAGRRQQVWWFPTVLAVGLVVVLGVGERQRWIGAAGQAGTPLWGFSQVSMAPKPPAVLRRCRSLAVVIQGLDRPNGEAAAGHAQVRAEGQAALRRRLVHSQVAQAEVLTWNRMILYIFLFLLITSGQWELTGSLQERHCTNLLGISKLPRSRKDKSTTQRQICATVQFAHEITFSAAIASALEMTRVY